MNTDEKNQSLCFIGVYRCPIGGKNVFFSRCRGFTITEVLMTLSLLVMFFAAAGEMFKSTVLVDRESQVFSDRASRVDSAMFQLRRDVWGSGRVAARGRWVELANSGGEIVWRIDSDGGVTRTDVGGHVTRWEGIAGKWTLGGDGVGVTISDGGEVPVRLVSQVLLAGRSVP